MRMLESLGLCGGTLAGADYRTLVESAGQAGFRFVTLWPTHFEDALASGLSVSDMRSILADNDVAVSELDPLCSWLPLDPGDDGLGAHFHRYTESDFFRIADALGARSLNVFHAARDSIPNEQVVESLGSLCERASAHDLVVSVEFMDWTPIRDLGDALSVVRAVGRSDCGVNLDTWHHFRTGGTIDDVASLTADELVTVQLSDVEPEAWDDPLEETARARRMPGDGAGRAGPVLEAIDHAGLDVPINLEVFSDELRALPPRRAANLLFKKLQRLATERRR